MSNEIEYIDEEGCTWESYQDYVFSRFGYMAYDSDTAAKVLETLKELYFGNQNNEQHYFIRESKGYEWAFQALLLEILSKADFTEYGTSPRGSWLTDKGRKLLKPIFEPESK